MRKSTAPITAHLGDGTRAMLVRAKRDYPILLPEEEAALARAWRYKGCVRSRDRLVMAHMPLAVRMARRFAGYGLPADDMLAYAATGLVKAAEKFDPDRGARFSTFSGWWMAEEMNAYAWRSRSMLRGPQSAMSRTLFFNLRRIKGEMGVEGVLTAEEAEGVRVCVAAAVPSAARITVEHIMDMDRFMTQSVLSADSAQGTNNGGNGGEGETWLSSLPDDSEPVDDALAAREVNAMRRAMLKTAVAALGERERAIFLGRRLREPALTLGELGERYGISRERVRQVENKAAKRVADAMRACEKSMLRQGTGQSGALAAVSAVSAVSAMQHKGIHQAAASI